VIVASCGGAFDTEALIDIARETDERAGAD
jgi:hypothetical protein